MKPEERVKRMIKELLKQYNCWYTMTIPSAFGGSTGIPDFTCVKGGRAMFIEAKAPGKKPTAIQNQQMQRIEAAGGKCFVVDGEESLKAVEVWLCT